MDGNSPCFNHKDSRASNIWQMRAVSNDDDLDFADATPLQLPE